jgi:DNA polymerase III epsilon subunit-like protein
MMNRSPNVGGPYEAIGAARRFAAIDVETANAQRASICAVGIAVVQDGEVTERHHWLVRPPDDYEDSSLFNTRIHGIRAADGEDAPAFASLVPRISDLLSGLPVVAHDASFDIPLHLHHGFVESKAPASELQHSVLRRGPRHRDGSSITTPWPTLRPPPVSLLRYSIEKKPRVSTSFLIDVVCVGDY